MAKRKDKKPKPHTIMASAWKCIDSECDGLTAEHADGSRPHQCAKCGKQTDGCEAPLQVYAPVPAGYVLAKCNGDAHTNSNIDHCMVCLGGTWGWVFYLQNKDQPAG